MNFNGLTLYTYLSPAGSPELVMIDKGNYTQYSHLFAGSITHWPVPAADISGDTHINLPDLGMFSQQWQAAGCTPPLWCGGADIDMSGAVGLSDWLNIVERWLE